MANFIKFTILFCGKPLGYLIHNIKKVSDIINDEDVNTLRDINNSNEIKHGLQYQTNEIPNVRAVLNKIIALVNN